jgi:AraC-like DNA-binding protein
MQSDLEVIQPKLAPMTMGQQGYEAHYQYSETMEVTQYHCHDFYELYLHIRGGEFMGLDNQLYRLQPNQLFIIPPFSMHGLSCTHEMRGYERCYLNISTDVMKSLGCGQIDLDHFLRSRTAQGQNTYQLTPGDAMRFASWLKELKSRESENASSVARFRNYTVLTELLNLICQTVCGLEPLEGDEVSNSVIQEVLTYINNHYSQPIRIENLARSFGVSISYLSHEFARFTNRSVYEYVLYRRVMLARQQMLGNESLNTIAYDCGFNDYSNFLRSFTKIVGVSPSQYRKQLRRYSNKEL